MICQAPPCLCAIALSSSQQPAYCNRLLSVVCLTQYNRRTPTTTVMVCCPGSLGTLAVSSLIKRVLYCTCRSVRKGMRRTTLDRGWCDEYYCIMHLCLQDPSDKYKCVFDLSCEHLYACCCCDQCSQSVTLHKLLQRSPLPVCTAKYVGAPERESTRRLCHAASACMHGCQH